MKGGCSKGFMQSMARMVESSGELGNLIGWLGGGLVNGEMVARQCRGGARVVAIEGEKKSFPPTNQTLNRFNLFKSNRAEIEPLVNGEIESFELNRSEQDLSSRL
ncbi:hypothetical protein J1N35_007056 [Gossypium stocksii]|uniref:Uncharacterized protein n=1 Tax=Gossypium stocksii TaxID=47602 RepID=A0A9D3W6S2_9ROSI|nr:hypothetical protein J1N35_007056 [Gossypium stocksii]